MGDIATFLLLLILFAIVGTWLRLSRARDKAIQEARARCQRYGLQLLDETVGLSGLRIRHMQGRRVIERRYSFDVSIDGNDREAGHLWMIGNVLTALILPTIELYTPDDDAHATPHDTHAAGGNVLPFRPRPSDKDVRH
ncbi:DUF3301 domain-containing protein [Dyella dinghuensis]|uniref:DUF3301 domain-containing protein n=1 Tax=Dyella dinghuensis TaxID=1920169 RepID=A0A3S0WML4_9GAMM|nr:DUF3301 domain-containing protein [Dyella dinghuensis]RUL62305.1 DUF3301 domain-containing protein [Dyella dinghuensis]